MPSVRTRTWRRWGASRARPRKCPARKLPSSASRDVEITRTVVASKDSAVTATTPSRRASPSISPAAEHPTRETSGKSPRSSSRQVRSSQTSPSPMAKMKLRPGGSSAPSSQRSRHPWPDIQRFCVTRTALPPFEVSGSPLHPFPCHFAQYRRNGQERQGENRPHLFPSTPGTPRPP